MLDRGEEHYRGCQIQSLVGGTATIRIQAEHTMVSTLTCDTGLIEAGASIGCGCYAKVTISAWPYIMEKEDFGDRRLGPTRRATTR